MTVLVLRGDARCLPLPDARVDLIVTSPPYFGLRSYTDGGEHYDGQIGSEATPGEYVAALVECTAEWVRVLKPSGSMFVNLGDKYSNGGRGYYAPGSKHLGETVRGVQRPDDGFTPKSLLGLPWRYALAACDQLGLILRAEIIWAKPNGLPESVTDRVRRAHEQVFHFTLRPRYYSAVDEIREPQTGNTHARRADGLPTTKQRAALEAGHRRGFFAENGENPLGKLPGSVWDIPSQPLTVPPALGVDHFAAFPMELPRRIIAGWSPPGVCCECGEGRRPVARVTNEPLHVQGNHGAGKQDQHGNRRLTEVRVVARSSATITGYACACPRPDAPVRPSTVLDPFGGTGTTALLASALGRHGISVDMSADYCRLAAWRTRDPAERARALEVPKPPPVIDGQDTLFPVP